MLTIHLSQPSSRHRYVVDVLRDWYDLPVEFSDAQVHPERVTAVWQGREVASWKRHVLGEEGVGGEAEVAWTKWDEGGEEPCTIWLPCAVDEEGRGLAMDPLAATFWALTCWGERNPDLERDQHGRPLASDMPWSHHPGRVFCHGTELEARLQHRWPWLELMWVGLLRSWDVSIPRGLRFQPTVDVDVAFKHLGRSRLKHVALQVRDALLGRWNTVLERLRVVRGLETDPYDTFGFLHEVHSQEALTWFVLAADRSRPFDIGLNPELDVLPSLVESLSNHAGSGDVCWHPGYKAMNDSHVCQREANRFWSWPSANREMIRAHFLRSEPSRDWVRWEAMGVAHDASLGWARDVGFRAGTSRPFHAYDVGEERVLALKIHPVAIMDSALKAGLGWKPDRAAQEMDRLMTVVSEVGGVWMSCWHNTSVSEVDGWKGWRATYLHMVQSARSLA
ncbi:MAG: hypothetical protein O2990_02330 [Bacteroidetes bacterium]|nr:hypothetical protein [Bacteroidota bacterium]